jgi:peptidoglycan hydrolase FlgJ
MTATTGLATDVHSLDRLKLDAARDPQGAVHQAAKQFESLFMQQVLKSMRDSVPKSELMGGGTANDMYTEMLDQQLAQSLSGRPGGLAEVIARQLSRNMAPAASGQASVAGNAPSPVIGGTAAPGAQTPVDPAAAAGQARLAAALRAARSQAAGTAGAAASPDPSGSIDLSKMSPKQVEFVRKVWSEAKAAEQQTGVPAAFVVGQAALESGWGRGEIRMPDGSSSHNVFGIKAGPGGTGPTVDVTTTEYVNGQATKQVQRFRAYGSYAEAFSDWSSMMGSKTRYAQALKTASSAQGFAQGMQRAGYATDPAYASKLERVINQTLALRRVVT